MRKNEIQSSGILEIAEEGKFAVPAFNVYNMEMVLGVIAERGDLRADNTRSAF